MITLRELFEVAWDITHVKATARDEDLMFLHEWIFDKDIEHLSTHQWHDQKDGKLSVIKGRVNEHGKSTRGGTEMGWGVNLKLFPPEMLDAPVTILRIHNGSTSSRNTLSADVTMSPLTVAAIIDRETQWYEGE